MLELPPSRKGREYELHAVGLRDFAGLRSPKERLDPFALARYAGLLVATFDQIAPLLSKETRDQLLGARQERLVGWGMFAATAGWDEADYLESDSR